MHLLATIANAFVKTSGVEAVSLGGSAALQKADALSDYDLYVYSRTPVPLEVRERIVSSRASRYQLDNTQPTPEPASAGFVRPANMLLASNPTR